MRHSARLLAGALALALVAGCGNENAGPGPVVGMVSTMAQATLAKAKARRAGGEAAQAAAPVTRADLEQYGKPILRTVVPSRGLDGFLTISDQKGAVVTWTTTDGATFSLRDGVLIQTRGLGPDLMSAEVPSVAALATAGGTHQRVYYFLGADDQGTRRTYDCTIKVIGPDRIEVFGRTHATTHVEETCARTYGSIKNDFWIEGAKIRQSRQWVSAGIGHVELVHVID